MQVRVISGLLDYNGEGYSFFLSLQYFVPPQISMSLLNLAIENRTRTS